MSAVVTSLTPSDFYKSMTTHADHRIWQEVYRTRTADGVERQAAELFGGGVNAFSRYENGKTKPPLALVKLFKLLDRHPGLLEELRAI